MRNLLALFVFLFFVSNLYSQHDRPAFTPGIERVKSLAERKSLREKSLFSALPFKSIGPSVFGGRVADVDVSPLDPTHFYVAYASSGLWKTVNNGQSFVPLFDHEMVMTIGDVAVDWERDVIWVGTGEVNSSRSSYAGVGIFRSADGGETWEYKGLPESHHIGRVILHPNDPNTVWVAVLGHLYSPNQERGVFKTTDGGETWKRTLFVDGETGAVDLLLDPQDTNTLFASTWERERSAWDFVGSGEGSGIWKSTDGGENWAKVSTVKSGFPTGEGAGRIGLSASVFDGKTVLFSIIDNQGRRPKKEEETEDGLVKEDFQGMTREAFIELANEELETFLRDNDFPEKYTAKNVKKQVRKNEIKPIALFDFLTNANSALFDTPVIGAEVFRSDDGGKIWQKTHEDYLNDLYYSYGYYFGQIRSVPDDPEQLYIFGVPILKSKDGGANWESINEANVHADHHALWVSPDREGHLILGNDGGINISYDDGENWVKCNTPPLGQFYAIAVDNQENYHVYGGLQDNGVWHGPHTYEASNRWHNTGRYPYQSILGGDGMQVAIDSRDDRTIYTGFQFGNYYRIDRVSGKRTRITPSHELGETPLRWNWQSPLHLSVHNEDILYMGAQRVYRSFNQGEDWEAISGDLTKGGKPGNVPYGTLTTIHESPLQFGLLYAGSDDGKIHLSKDGGHSWKRISDDLLPDMWVSRVQASQHVEGRVFASLNGYRWDDARPFVYISENYGETWEKITNGLPLEAVNVVKEDPVNPDLIYVGTDHGLYFSLDRGANFFLADEGLPAVPVHDVVVHPRENHLVVGTHGRSLYLADIQHVQQLSDSIMAQPLHVFSIEKLKFDENWGDKSYTWSDDQVGAEISIPMYSATPGKMTVQVKAGKNILWKKSEIAKKGINYFIYTGEVYSNKISAYEKWLNEEEKETVKLKAGDDGKYYLMPGTYILEFEKDGKVLERELVVEE